jgi:hypothetical protein
VVARIAVNDSFALPKDGVSRCCKEGVLPVNHVRRSSHPAPQVSALLLGTCSPCCVAPPQMLHVMTNLRDVLKELEGNRPPRAASNTPQDAIGKTFLRSTLRMENTKMAFLVPICR